MLTTSVLYFALIFFMTGGGIVLTRLGTNTGHFVASAVGAFGCVLAAAVATVTLGMSSAIGALG